MRNRVIRGRAPATQFAVLVMVSLVIAACGSSTTPTSPSAGSSSKTSSKHVNIAFLNESLTSYTIPMTNSMMRAAAADNASVKMFNANNDPSTQNSQCQTAISSGTYQAIIDYPVSGPAAVPCAKAALAAHVPFIPLDSPVGPDPTSTAIQVPGIKAQVLGAALGVDVNGTVQLVKMACSHFPPPCTIVQTEAIPAFFYSSYKLSHEQARFRALGYKILATLVIGNFDAPDALKSAIETVLAKTPNIDVIVSDDDSSVQGAVQLKKAGKLPKTLVIGDGGSSLGLRSIRQGYEFGTVNAVPRTEAAVALREAVDLVRGLPVPPPVTKTQLDLTNHYILTRQDAFEVQPQW